LKQEIRLLKQEVDLLPKDKRKDEFRKRKTMMEFEHEEREKTFLTSLSESHELALRRISEIYREKLASTDKGYLQQKQTVSVGIFFAKSGFDSDFFLFSRRCELVKQCCGNKRRSKSTKSISCPSVM
jgi:Polo kinase kinase